MSLYSLANEFRKIRFGDACSRQLQVITPEATGWLQVALSFRVSQSAEPDVMQANDGSCFL
jgi:hypothetical protein